MIHSYILIYSTIHFHADLKAYRVLGPYTFVLDYT